jgi:mono/diheme cytochrome c family protein
MDGHGGGKAGNITRAFSCPALCIVSAVIALANPCRAAEDVAGQKAYARTCQQCHGAPMKGAEGPALIPLAHTADQIKDIVRFGTGEMKALANTSISDEELAAVIAYLSAADKAK